MSPEEWTRPWGHRQALARLRERGQSQVNEQVLFRMIEQMRHIAETAETTTKRTRRERQRRAVTPARPQPTPPTLPPPDDAVDPDGSAHRGVRFEEIEQW